jgi:hypothetical protein
MGLWARVLLGTAGLMVFAVLAIGDARELRARRGASVAWTMAATGATVLAGFVHLALTPEHWEESVSYGLFFLAAGVVQLAFASVLTRPGATASTWLAAVATNLALVVVYVDTRLVAPVGSDVPESVDALGVITVMAELLAATAGILIWRRHLSRSGAPRSRPRTGPSCPDPRVPGGGSGTRNDQ